MVSRPLGGSPNLQYYECYELGVGGDTPAMTAYRCRCRQREGNASAFKVELAQASLFYMLSRIEDLCV